jgi:hypothetical protein
MEALNALFRAADKLALFSPLGIPSIRYRAFLYADDLVILVCPPHNDIALVCDIMELFAQASDLDTNIAKCQFTQIRCTEEQIEQVQEVFPCQLTHFPCRYLGIHLSVYQLKKSDMPPLVDAVAGRLPSWRGRLMSKAGRTTLTRVTLSAIPIHVAIVVKFCPSIRHEIDKIRQAFISTGTDKASGGQCMVAWSGGPG